MTWASLPCFTLAAPWQSDDRLGMPATPVSLWLSQRLPAASAPAPGPHVSRLGTCLRINPYGRQLYRIAPGPFQSQVKRYL